ncbi:hypothetical protein Vadar_003510 [Vaccinium darrowii]|uniref:Uncharacterized protein n=1 Tax=Vaccinium darrowii TaxID=229202 RepID=A0ACB7YSF8_9ERIC|nr:hypothetical protein Vadar_003510 [Vaccinium darrowii]
MGRRIEEAADYPDFFRHAFKKRLELRQKLLKRNNIQCSLSAMLDCNQKKFLMKFSSWRTTSVRRKIPVVSWHNVTMSKESGWLRIRKIRGMSEALVYGEVYCGEESLQKKVVSFKTGETMKVGVMYKAWEKRFGPWKASVDLIGRNVAPPRAQCFSWAACLGRIKTGAAILVSPLV